MEEFLEHRRAENVSIIYNAKSVKKNAGDDEFQKVGKVFSKCRSFAMYKASGKGGDSRRKPLGRPGTIPTPDEVSGYILFDFTGLDTLFSYNGLDHDKSVGDFLLQFLEAFVTALLFPSLDICPSMSQYGDGGINQRDDPKWFAILKRFLRVAKQDMSSIGDALKICPGIRASILEHMARETDH